MWRFCVLLASILSILVILFPPWLLSPNKAGVRNKPVAPVATYSPLVTPPAPPLATEERAQPVAPTPANQIQSIPSSTPAKQEDSSPQAVSMHLSPPDATLAKSQSQMGNAPPILMGKVFTGFFPAAGRKLPLPPGSWTVLADLRIGPESSTYFLAKIENKRLVGAVTFILESFKEGVQYKPATQCTNPQNLYAITESNQDARDGGSQAFWFIHNIFAKVWGQWADKNLRMDPLARAAGGEMEIRQITLPQDLIQVNFLRVEKWGRVVGSYYFSPEVEHITSKTASNWMDNDWSYLNYEKYPEKVAYINKLKEWGQAWWPRFKNCVDSPLSSLRDMSAAEIIKGNESGKLAEHKQSSTPGFAESAWLPKSDDKLQNAKKVITKYVSEVAEKEKFFDLSFVSSYAEGLINSANQNNGQGIIISQDGHRYNKFTFSLDNNENIYQIKITRYEKDFGETFRKNKIEQSEWVNLIHQFDTLGYAIAATADGSFKYSYDFKEGQFLINTSTTSYQRR